MSLKMMYLKKLLLLIFPFLFLSGCLKDNPLEQTVDMKDSAELLVYLETNGDFINSTDCPAYVKANEVYTNLSNYLIIDIREKEEFKNGHIPNSRNVSLKDLYDFVKSNHDSFYSKIVLVSNTGQSAAYAASLLKLAGFNKVYSLQFGIASWNPIFSNLWYRKVKNGFQSGRFNFFNYPKPSLRNLPDKDLGNGTTKELLQNRIKTLLNEGFAKVRIDIDSIMKTYNPQTQSINYFVICYAPTRLYSIHDNGHPPSSIRYEPRIDLKSSTYLQSLPIDQTIAIYDDTGEIAAYVTAYLRILGYDARTIDLGANGIIGEDQINSTRIIRLRSSDIMNYPFESGEN